jgi:predicted MFS family arabinose efflux permease
MNQIRTKLWSKDFIMITITNFLVSLTFFLLMTTITVYAIEEFHASKSKAGLASSIFVIGTLFSRLISGKYIEIVGRKKLLFSGLFLSLAATLLYFSVRILDLLLIVRFIHGAAFGIVTTVTGTAVMDLIPKDRRGEGTSYFTLSVTLATAIGAFLGVFISQQAGFNMVFLFCTIVHILTIFISLLIHVPKANMTKEQIDEMKGFTLNSFYEKKSVPISIIAGIMGFTYSGILSFLTSFALTVNLTAAASYFFIVYALFILISRPFTGKLYDVKGDNIVMYPSLFLFSVGLLLLSQAHIGFTLLIAGAFIGLGYGTIISCAQTIAINEAAHHRVGLATSTYFIFMNAGIGIGPYLLGFIIPFVNFRGMYLTLAVMILACIFLYYFLHGRRKSFLQVKYKNLHL